MKFFVCIFCSFLCVSSYAEEWSGYYSSPMKCLADDLDFGGIKDCKSRMLFSSLIISEAKNGLYNIELTTVAAAQTRDDVIDPFYCGIKGVAKLNGGDIYIITDDDGRLVDKLKVIKGRAGVVVVDTSNGINEEEYCGARAFFDGVVLRKIKKPKATRKM